MSLPCAIAPIPDAIEAPAPPDDPPQVIDASQGFSVCPCSGLSVNARMENSGVLVMPMMTAPARRRLATTGESPGAIMSLKAGHAVGIRLARHVDIDLHRDRHAMQRAQRVAACRGLIGGGGFAQRLLAQIDDHGVDRRVGGVHAVQMRRHHGG